MARAHARHLLVSLAVLAVMGGIAAGVSAAPKDMITLSVGQAVAVNGTNVEAVNASRSTLLAERGCFTGEPALGTTFVVGGVEYDDKGNIVSLEAELGGVPANGASAVVTKVFPEGAKALSLPDFRGIAQPSHTLPTINLPAQQLQAQIALGGDLFMQFAGFNSGLGFNEPFVGAVTVEGNGNLHLNGFELTMSSKRGEVEKQAPGEQPYQFSQPFSYDCDKTKRARGLVAKTYRFFSQVERIRRAIPPVAARAFFLNWWKALRKEEKWFEDVETHLKADDYMPVFNLGDSIISEQKKLDLAAAKLAPHIKTAATRSKFLELERQEHADVVAAVAAIEQAITPAA